MEVNTGSNRNEKKEEFRIVSVYNTTMDYNVRPFNYLLEKHSGIVKIGAYGLIIIVQNRHCSIWIESGPLTTKSFLIEALVHKLRKTDWHSKDEIQHVIDKEKALWNQKYGNLFRVAAEQKLKRQKRELQRSLIDIESLSDRERRLFFNNPFRPK